MPETGVVIRLSLRDADTVQRALEQLGAQGERALKRIEAAGSAPSAALRALGDISADLHGQITSLADGSGLLGRVLGEFGPLGIGAAAAFGALAIGLEKGIEKVREAEAAHLKLQAVLQATGHASGMTIEAVESVVKEVTSTTLASKSAVEQAVTELASFRVPEGNFSRAIKLAQDFSAVFGVDLPASAAQIGKAMQDPVNGLTALERKLGQLDPAQKQLIADFEAQGDKAQASGVVLDWLAGKVGGAGAAEGQGLAGASDRASKAWGSFLRTLGETSGAAETSGKWLDVLASSLSRLTALMKATVIPGTVDYGRMAARDALEQLEPQLSAAEKRLEQLRTGSDAASRSYTARSGRPADSAPAQDIAAQQDIVNKLREQVDAVKQRAQQEEQAAAAGQHRADIERKRADIAQQQARIDKETDATRTSAAERISKVREDSAKRIQEIEARRTPETTADVDATIARQRELAARQIEAIERPEQQAAQRASDAAARRAEAEERAAERIRAANEKVIDSLERDYEGLDDSRQKAIDDALARLNDQATEAQKADVVRLATETYNRRELAKADAEGMGLRSQIYDERQQGLRLHADGDGKARGRAAASQRSGEPGRDHCRHSHPRHRRGERRLRQGDENDRRRRRSDEDVQRRPQADRHLGDLGVRGRGERRQGLLGGAAGSRHRHREDHLPDDGDQSDRQAARRADRRWPLGRRVGQRARRTAAERRQLAGPDVRGTQHDGRLAAVRGDVGRRTR